MPFAAIEIFNRLHRLAQFIGRIDIAWASREYGIDFLVGKEGISFESDFTKVKNGAAYGIDFQDDFAFAFCFSYSNSNFRIGITAVLEVIKDGELVLFEGLFVIGTHSR